MSNSFPSKYDNTCAKCGGKVVVGSLIYFPQHGSKDVMHETCPKLSDTTPPLGALPAGRQDSDHFVQIAAWVPIDRTEGVLKAIREARGW